MPYIGTVVNDNKVSKGKQMKTNEQLRAEVGRKQIEAERKGEKIMARYWKCEFARLTKLVFPRPAK